VTATPPASAARNEARLAAQSKGGANAVLAPVTVSSSRAIHVATAVTEASVPAPSTLSAATAHWWQQAWSAQWGQDVDEEVLHVLATGRFARPRRV
jgi:hypothetical protein